MPKPQLVPLGSLLTGIDAGHSPDVEDTPAGSGEWGVLKVSAVGADGFHPHENKVVREQRLHNPVLRVRAGDLLITRANTAQLVGLACIAEDAPAELMLSDKTLRLRVDKRIALVRYIQAVLGSPLVRRQIENLATGTSGSMKNISQRSIQNLMIPFSGTEDARQIADILDSADDQIRATEAALRKLTALKSGVIRAAFDGMPQATDRSTVGALFSIKSGITLGPHRMPGEKASKYLRVANVQRAWVDLSDVALLQASAAEKAELQLAVGDLLVVEGHANPGEIGRCALVSSDAAGLLYQNHLFRLRSAKVDPEFAELWLNSDETRAYWQRMTATSSGLYTINSRMLRELPFPIVAPEDQADVVNAQRLVANTVKVLHEELDKFRLIKRGLIDGLLAGRLRMPTLYLCVVEFAVEGDAVGQGEDLVKVRQRQDKQRHVLASSRNVRPRLYRRKRNSLPEWTACRIGIRCVRDGDYVALGPEYEEVELPLIDQLTGMGWTHLEGAPPGTPAPIDPKMSGRASFSEVILEGRLRAQLRITIKDNHGQPWLDERRISQAVAALTRVSAACLLEANQKATDLLINGTTVEGLPGWDGGRDQRIHYIDWENWDKPHANDCVVVSQFRVDIPGTQGRKYIVPDEVLFVNGIPLALVECKKPGSSLKTAIDQHLRYADRRGAPVQEGNEKLFHTVQLLVATTGDKAVLGSITSGPRHYTPWRDPYPLTEDELAERLRLASAQAVTQQDILAGVVLHPSWILDIVHNYVTFMRTDDGTMIKAVPRYQQYRAVEKAVDHLLNGQARSQSSDDQDHRGGVVWHTQGSGKSLTMSFLVRKMRTVSGLRKTKIVIVTDRNQLQSQLSETLELTGEMVDVAKQIRRARTLLSQHGPGIVCVMIQKQQDPDATKSPKNARSNTGKDDIVEGKAPDFPELNADESIVVLIDEAHRSHSSTLHMNLLSALPNAARIGFTGTPILMGQKKRTTRIFGPYIDVYRLADAERDKAVVPIYYAGRTVKGAVRDGRDMDEVFEDMLADHTPAEMEEIKKRYATKGDVMEAEELIAAKAKNMLKHYVETVLPNGFKAQVAAHSRTAAVRYRAAFLKARDELVARNPKKQPPDVIDQVKRLDFIPVISPAENDPKAWETWTEPSNQEKAIGDFKNPAKPPAFLIVKSMLLTGFDAPVEQVLYLDRSMKEAELLQAIARVNRPAAGTGNAPKQCGYVIDYVGVTQHLTKALKAYADEDIEGVLTNLETDQVGNLRAQRARVRAVFTDHGVTPGPSAEARENCVLLLADGAIQDRFETELNGFLATVDTVLPLPSVREFLPDAQLFAEIATRARRRYRENGDFDPSLYGEKVRELIDEHMTSLGVDQVLPPVSITDPEYQARAAKLGPRARASEMEHAIRHHIRLHMDEDPTRYRRLSERLEQILEEHRDNWEQQAFALSEFLDKFNGDFPGTSRGDSPGTSRLESALYGLLAEETATDGVIGQEQAERLGGFSRKLNSLAFMRTKKRDFWRHPADQTDFTKEITVALITDNVCQPEQAPALADKLTEIIRANKAYLQSHD